MRKIKIQICVYLSAFILLFQFSGALACTTFQIGQKGDSVIGYSFAFPAGAGMVVINPRGMSKQAFVPPPHSPARWTSRFGSLTFNQIGREFPYCGINEKRLVITEMALDRTMYPPDNDRPAVNELQWIQYHLDTCAYVSEVVRSCREVRVAPAAAKLHYLVCDAAGECASISYLEGKLEITPMTDDVPRVMTNSPYSDLLALLEAYDGFGGTKPFPVSMDSPSRFIRTSMMIKRDLSFSDNNYGLLEYATDCLPLVAQKNWQWSIVFDQNSGKIWFKTRTRPQPGWVQMTRIDFSSRIPCRILNLDEEAEGERTDLFIPYTTELNRIIAGEAFETVDVLKRVPETFRNAMWTYPESISVHKEPSPLPEAVLPGVISDAGHRLHGFPAFTADGEEVFWPVVPPRILTSRREGDKWSLPETAAFSRGNIQAVNVHPDGNRIFFQMVREDGMGSLDIWYTERRNGGWSDPVNAGAPVNSELADSQPSFTADGSMYFTRTMTDTIWNRGIFCCAFREGKYQPAEALPASINTPYIDSYPFVAPDGGFLLFCSSRPSEKESELKLMISFREDDGSWREPVNLSKVLGLEGGARFPALSRDGRWFYYLYKNRIYQVPADFLQSLRPL